MYQMKTIVPTEDNITLPQCMYYIKNPNNNLKIEEEEINISEQGSPNNTMHDLEQRQNQLLQKLDVLYDRIKTISTLCKTDIQPSIVTAKVEPIPVPEEIVIVLHYDTVPSFLFLLIKKYPTFNVSWHIHSSVPYEEGLNIKDFFLKNKSQFCLGKEGAKTNLRLIFKYISASAELRMSSMEVPLLGIVNTLRYLCLLYPNFIPYDQSDYHVDNFLDQCHSLEKSLGKKREEIVAKMFSQCTSWVYKNELSIIDLAAYIIMKKQNILKLAPKPWYVKCEDTFW